MLVRIETNCDDLFLSYKDGDFNKFKNLVNSGANVNCLNRKQMSLISDVLINIGGHENEKNKEFFNLLIDEGVHLNGIGLEFPLLYMSIAFQDDIYYSKKLLEAGVDVNSGAARISTENKRLNLIPIMNAFLMRDIDKFNLILDYNPNINIQNRDGTLLIRNMFEDDIEFLKRIFPNLINAGLDVMLKDKYNTSFFDEIMRSKIKQKSEFVKLFLENNIDVNSVDSDGCTAAIIVAKLGQEEIMKILFEYGADANARSSNMETPAMAAVANDNYFLLPLLYENGADFKLKNEIGDNIAHIAARKIPSMYAKYTTVEFLIKEQNLLFSQNKLGQTPMDLLKENCNSSYLEVRQKLKR